MRVAIACLLAGCHVASMVETIRPGETKHEVLRDHVTAGAATAVVTDAGLLRFVETERCETRDTIEQRATTERVLEPNIAGFVVGIVASAVGGVALAVAGFSDDPTGSPALYAGGLGLAVGLPLAIGPWIGLTHELASGRTLSPVVRPGAVEACGEHAIVARSATVSIDAADVRGKIAADGTFSISPFALLDAYTPDKLRPLEVTAILDLEGGTTRTVSTIVNVGPLAAKAPAYLASLEHHDPKIEPFRMVPGLTPGTLRVSITSTSEGPAVRVVLPIENKGPGDATGVRGQLDSPVRAIHGRMMYFGKIAAGAVVSREIIIPVASDIASMIRNATIQVTVELRDGHGTAPEMPVKFNGSVLVDLPR